MEYEKKKPAPSKYEHEKSLKKKIAGSYDYRDTRVHFTDHQKWLAHQVPPARYDVTNVKMTKPRLFSTHIKKADPKPAASFGVPKMDGPGPGSYNTS